MTDYKVENVNVVSQTLLPSPSEIKNNVKITDSAAKTVFEARETIKKILDHKDQRLLVVTGPCSIHDEKAALEYATKLRALSEEVKDTLYLVMRVYFEKPRTVVGWKGYINDPYMDDSFKIEEGLVKGRSLLLKLAEMGLATGSEALDPISPQYMDDLLGWIAIGARTTESQTHREMASGLSAPVGFKNGTDGSLTVAINAMKSSASPHHFLGINQDGQTSVIQTSGNSYGHVILRGGKRPNYDSVSVAQTEKLLTEAGLPLNIVIDCSHGNSLKDASLQPLVVKNCISQIRDGNSSIIGLMLESNLNFGKQSIPEDLSQLKYGVSVTDACIDWQTTEDVLRGAHEALKDILPKRP